MYLVLLFFFVLVIVVMFIVVLNNFFDFGVVFVLNIVLLFELLVVLFNEY